MDWRTSSFSGNSGNCVQVRKDLAALRDSKRPTGPTLSVNLSGMLAAIKLGHLDR
jgi:hypothetical protein